MGKGGHPALEQLDGFAQGSSQDVASWEALVLTLGSFGQKMA
jgi:hypothetical protein